MLNLNIDTSIHHWELPNLISIRNYGVDKFESCHHKIQIELWKIQTNITYGILAEQLLSNSWREVLVVNTKSQLRRIENFPDMEWTFRG